MFRQPQYCDGQRVATLTSPSGVKFAQNPTAILTIVEQDVTPKGQCCSLSLEEPNDFRVNGRQISEAANDDKLFKSNVLDDDAIKKGFSHGAQ
jgi:hypothetical protein